MIHETGRYRDPLLILLRREEQAEKKAARPRGRIQEDPFGAIWAGSKIVMTREESDDVEELLGSWFRWTRAYREALGAVRAAPSCKGYTAISDEQAEADEIDARLAGAEAAQVEACLDSLTGLQRAVIGINQANKHGPQVYSHPRLSVEQAQHEYQAAKVELLPLLRKRGLVAHPAKSACMPRAAMA